MTDLSRLRDELTGLEGEEAQLLDSLNETRSHIRACKLELCQHEHGVAIGSIVQDRKGHEYRVTSINTDWKRPWLYGVRFLKNGEWGTREFHLYGEWEIVK